MYSHDPSRRIGSVLLMLVLGMLLTAASAIPAAAFQSLPTIEEKTADMTAMEGYFNIYWDESTGKLFWEIDKWDTEFLYAVSLASGLGSNPVGLDRGQRGISMILKANRVGPRVLLVQPNYRYRANSDNPAEVRAVHDAFASSTHWGFTIAAQTGDRVLVDATDFFMQDTHRAARRLGDGFRLDRSRSVFYLPRTKAFPKNTEIETALTFTSQTPSRDVSSTAASGQAVTLRQHHSLVELPDDDYMPRRVDPRISGGGITIYDYASPIDQDLTVTWLRRHRIKKRNPRAARSEPVEPIVYYVDPGAPEPIRSALTEGASWWNQAFEAAGFINGFQVRVLPDDADPMDLRYNMIHWTHRSTRGWSYGGSVVDPRTGEIIKGNVNLGSLRLRQDVLLGRGMIPAYEASGPGADPFNRDGIAFDDCGFEGGPDFSYLPQVMGEDSVEMALARVRQLSAHEVGHTLGYAHNYIASTYAGRASVMDYPAPLIEITRDGRLDFSNAYAVGIGEYDKLAVRYVYSDFPPGADEEAELERIVQDGLRRGMRFNADQDGTPPGSAHPYTAVWDNGADPVDYLSHEYEVRRIGLAAFGENSIPEGKPLAALEAVLVPLYLHHRYQMEAAAHSIGGADYTYAVRGDGQTPFTIVAPAKQRQALGLLLESLAPDFLALPDRVLNLIPPRAFGVNTGEIFQKRTGQTFDPIGIASTTADMTVRLILNPQRMARLVDFHARDDSYPGLDEVVDRLIQATWGAPMPADGYRAEIQAATRRVVIDRLMVTAGSGASVPSVRAILNANLHNLRDGLASIDSPTPYQLAAAEDITRWINRAEGLTAPSQVPGAPPGSPIGQPDRPPIPPVR